MSTQQTMRKKIRVVAALIWDGDKIFVQQRPAGCKFLPLLWEFPGGKVEPGESDVAALERECREEMDVAVIVGGKAFETDYAYEHMDVTLVLYHAHLREPGVQPKSHAAEQVRWERASALHTFDFCPADRPLIDALVSGAMQAPDPLAA